MGSKSIIFHDEARAKMQHGIHVLAQAVIVTLGPRGRTVVLQNDVGPPRIVNSGVIVARTVSLENRFENMGIHLMREVAVRTSELAGDGTTTATVLAYSMVQEGLRYLAAGMNPIEMKMGMEKATHTVTSSLKTLAKPCNTTQEIAHVASISANNDPSIGILLANAIDKVGREGAIFIEDGSSLISQLEVVDGMQFARGYLSPHFVNNAERQSATLDDAFILVLDEKLSNMTDLLALLEEVIKVGRPLLLITEDIDSDPLAALVINKIRGILKVCVVKAPEFGDRRKAMMKDIAILTGGVVVSDAVGLPLKKAQLTDLGRAKHIEITRENTTIVGGAGTPQTIGERVAQIKKERELSITDYERENLNARIARLSGGVAVIKVGAATDVELKERKIRLEDALHATRAAIEEGIVPGGGVALLRARDALAPMQGQSLSETAGIHLVFQAMDAPLQQIVRNAGEESSVVMHTVEASTEPAFGFNALTLSFGNLLEMGVIDPAKVTRLALQNAASIAALILTTDCMIASEPELIHKPMLMQQQHMPMDY